nr:PREDICTED: ankyrin repeat-containing protein At3g12360-like [Daucus carota subsp. sativus]
MEKKLYDACYEGDVDALEALIQGDKFTLARVSLSSTFNQTPLHLASMLGHLEFVKSLLSYKPDFAKNLDLQGRSALHLASANGYPSIVKLLIEYDENMCRLCDEDGRTPLHLAVFKGQDECVSELLKVDSESDQERTMLQLCVKYNRLDVLILILESNDQDLSNIKHDDGNTILHSATALGRIQIIKYLVKCRSEVDVNAVNKGGLTALDIIEEMPKDVKNKEIREFLISAGTTRAKSATAATPTSLLIPGEDGVESGHHSKLLNLWKEVKNSAIFHEEVERRDDTLLVGASVIAAMAYTAAISPPGGVTGFDADAFSDAFINSLDSNSTESVLFLPPGGSLLAYFWPGLSDAFWISNTISFMAALSVIFLYVSGYALKKKIFVLFIRGAMWLTLTSMTTAYVCAVVATSPGYSKGLEASYKYNKTDLVLVIGFLAWIGMIVVALLVAAYPYVRSIVMKIIRRIGARNKVNTYEDANTVISTPDTHIV